MPSAAAGRSEKLIANDAGMARLLTLVSRVAVSNSSVLLVGEPGTGKSLLARQVHSNGPRAGHPFVEIPCANLPPELVESELFGHERGAFTGAVARRIGRFEAADGGTVLIDGISDLPPSLQAKLLRVLQHKQFERLGGSQTIAVDVRILASASPEIERMVERGEFREDLYYRINVFTLRIPPLRERGADIVTMASLFLQEAARRNGSKARRFSSDAIELLTRYEWPGNVRELRNACEFASLRAVGSEATLADLPLDSIRAGSGLVAHGASREMSLEELEVAYIREVLRRTGGNRSAAARILGINRKTLLEKRRRYGID